MKVRKAFSDDLKTISDIENTCFLQTEAASFKSLKERFKIFSDLFFVLEDDNDILGFILGMSTNRETIIDEMFEKPCLHNENGRWNSIFSLAILPRFQGNGYSKLLMQEYIQNAKRTKKLGCILTCKKELIHFYETFGYENNGISKSIHGNSIWYDMILKFD